MENKAMLMNDFIQDYLGDKDEGLKAFVTVFLNPFNSTLLPVFLHFKFQGR